MLMLCFVSVPIITELLSDFLVEDTEFNTLFKTLFSLMLYTTPHNKLSALVRTAASEMIYMYYTIILGTTSCYLEEHLPYTCMKSQQMWVISAFPAPRNTTQ